MRLSPFVIAALLVLAVSAAAPAAMAFPVLPHAFCGDVEVNGVSAPDGTPVSAKVSEGTLIPGEQNPVATTGGSYGKGGALPLLVQGTDIPDGAIVSFYVFGIDTGETAVFRAGGGPTTVNLSIIWEPVPPEITSVTYNPDASAGHRELFACEPNIIQVNVSNNFSLPAENLDVRLSIGTYDRSISIPEIPPFECALVNFTGYTPDATGDVEVIATLDNGTDIQEYRETATIYYNGYKGKRWTGGDDLLTAVTHTGRINAVYSTGDAAYAGNGWTEKTVGWTAENLTIPAEAAIRSATLYQGYTWNRMATEPAPQMILNDVAVLPSATYTDRKGYGGYNYPGGLLVYDVTCCFDPCCNTLCIIPENGADYAIYGTYLVVIYEHAQETEKTILVNNGYDLLQSHPGYCTDDAEATAYAPFSGLNPELMSGATAVAVVNGRPAEGKSAFLFNEKEYPGFWTAYEENPEPQVGFSAYNVTDALRNGENEAGVQSVCSGSSGDSIQAVSVILIAELITIPPAPVANFTATPTYGITPLTVQFTDCSTDAASWFWEFSDGATSSEQNPVHTFVALKPGRNQFSVSLAVTNIAGSDTQVRKDYITVDPEKKTEDISKKINQTTGETNETIIVVYEGSANVTVPEGTVALVNDQPIVNLSISLAPIGAIPEPPVGAMIIAGGKAFVFEPEGATFNPAIPVTITFTADEWAILFGGGKNTQLQRFDTTLNAWEPLANQTVDEAAYTITGWTTKFSTFAPVTTAKPVANFTAAPTSGNQPLAVQFTDQSANIPTSWLWSFGDGATSSEQNPTHTYSVAGTYTVSLTATNAAGSDTMNRTGYIVVNQGGGGGGGGITVIPPEESVGSASLMTDASGQLLASYIVGSPSKAASLSLNKGMRALDKDGKPLGTISIDDLAAANVPAVPSDAAFSFAGHAVTCSPADATFSPSAQLTFEFTEAQWNAIVAKADQETSYFTVKWYNPASKAWEDVQTTVNKDARTISATIEHFSTFGVFIESKASAAVPVDTLPAASASPSQASAAAPEVPGEFPWMSVIIGVVILLLIAGGVYYYTKKP